MEAVGCFLHSRSLEAKIPPILHTPRFNTGSIGLHSGTFLSSEGKQMEYWIKLIGKSSSMGSILVAAIGLAFPPHAAAQLDNALNDLKNLVDNTRKSKDRIESSPNLASTSKSVEQVNVAERFATLVATPKGTDYSHNDWSKISDLFPNVSFKNINDKAYAFSRNAIYRIGGSEYSLSVKGARSMIMRAEMQSVRKCPANAP